jgi:hypothetical protein
MNNLNIFRTLTISVLAAITGFMIDASSTLSAQEFSRFRPEQYDPDQNYGTFNFAQLTYFKGDHMTYPNSFEDAFSKGYNAVEFRLGWQSTGRQTWQRLHNYPVYGLGVFASSLGESDVDSIVGTPSGIYFFYGEPIVRFRNFTLMFDLGIGLSYDFIPYDAENNPTNDVIGSRINLYFNGNLIMYYRVTESLDLSLGANFFHFSNGRSNTPQRGINLGGLNIGAKYNFNPMIHYTKYARPDYRPPVRPEFIEAPKPALDRYGELQFMASIGTVMTEPGETKAPDGSIDTLKQERYSTSTVSLEYAYLAGRTLKLHAGLDAMYDASMVNYHPGVLPGEVDFGGKFMAGYHLGFQYLIERFAFYFAYGRYLYKESPTRGEWYMRVGGRVGLTPKLDAHIALKTRNGGIADWIEWGLAYKLKIHD